MNVQLRIRNMESCVSDFRNVNVEIIIMPTFRILVLVL